MVAGMAHPVGDLVNVVHRAPALGGSKRGSVLRQRREGQQHVSPEHLRCARGQVVEAQEADDRGVVEADERGRDVEEHLEEEQRVEEPLE